jgi:hypothetical protein
MFSLEVLQKPSHLIQDGLGNGTCIQQILLRVHLYFGSRALAKAFQVAASPANYQASYLPRELKHSSRSVLSLEAKVGSVSISGKLLNDNKI